MTIFPAVETHRPCPTDCPTRLERWLGGLSRSVWWGWCFCWWWWWWCCWPLGAPRPCIMQVPFSGASRPAAPPSSSPSEALPPPQPTPPPPPPAAAPAPPPPPPRPLVVDQPEVVRARWLAGRAIDESVHLYSVPASGSIV